MSLLIRNSDQLAMKVNRISALTLIILLSMSYLADSIVDSNETMDLPIETLHDAIPKELGTDWKQWKRSFNEFNDRIWRFVTAKRDRVLLLSVKPRQELLKEDTELDKLLADERLAVKITKRQKFAKIVRCFYFYSLLIVSALQVFATETRPRLEAYQDSGGGQRLETKPLIAWIKQIRPKFESMLRSVERAKRRAGDEWPINWTSTKEAQDLLDEVNTYEGYGETLIEFFLERKEDLRRYIGYYTKYTPDLFDMLVIQRRYLDIVTNMTVNLPKVVIRAPVVRKRVEYEVNFWFETLVIVYILLWIVFHTFTAYRLFIQKH